MDLARTDNSGVKSTHTLLVYLTTCEHGGETALLRELPTRKNKMKGKECAHRQDAAESGPYVPHEPQCEDFNILEAVKPVRGRILIFPHLCPHEGREVVSVPKVCIRSELC